MPVTVRKELYAAAPDRQTTDTRSQRYVNGTGFGRVEHRSLQREADWTNGDFERFSDDNGRTWGPWQDVYDRGHQIKGQDEITTHDGDETYNPRYGHFVSVGMRRIFFGGHKKAYERYWGRGEAAFVDHSLLKVRPDGSDQAAVDLIKYEDGADYDPDNWRDPAYIDRNRAYFGCGVDVLDSGEILFGIDAAMPACCRILGVDVNEVFPSCPDIMHGMIVARGTFDEARGSYDLTFSRPIVISDLKSSRGVNESNVMMLPSGRILAVFRGSNVQSKGWRTRIEPGTPGHKWYCWSDDGGRTFTAPVPWHFEDGEVFYSASSKSNLIRSIRDGNVYWIGNISDHAAYSNGPRYPLVIGQVNGRGLLLKDSVTTIDTRQEGDSERITLSDPRICQDRETGRMELYLNRQRQREGYDYWADCYRYIIDVDRPPERI